MERVTRSHLIKRTVRTPKDVVPLDLGNLHLGSLMIIFGIIVISIALVIVLTRIDSYE